MIKEKLHIMGNVKFDYEFLKTLNFNYLFGEDKWGKGRFKWYLLN